jgi:hypothetical protein
LTVPVVACSVWLPSVFRYVVEEAARPDTTDDAALKLDFPDRTRGSTPTPSGPRATGDAVSAADPDNANNDAVGVGGAVFALGAAAAGVADATPTTRAVPARHAVNDLILSARNPRRATTMTPSEAHRGRTDVGPS